MKAMSRIICPSYNEYTGGSNNQSSSSMKEDKGF
jgi:hypothetical protein